MMTFSAVSERICDTVVDMKFSSKEDSKCIDLMGPVCSSKDMQIVDKTCRTVVNYDCSAVEAASAALTAASTASYAAASAAQAAPAAPRPDGVNSGSTGGIGAFLGSFLGGGSGSNGYGSPSQPAPAPRYNAPTPPPPQPSGYKQEVVPTCRKVEEVKCYDTPRTVSTVVCAPGQNKVGASLVVLVLADDLDLYLTCASFCLSRLARRS